MQRFQQLATEFSVRFNIQHFPAEPQTLYGANDYFLQLGGKRIRPVLCLLANGLFSTIKEDAYEVAAAIELFHNFTLIHDDIMDEAPLRRGMQTVHCKYGNSTALLAGDVMLVRAYEYITKIDNSYLKDVLHIFSKTATEVCEGQQLDMDFEKRSNVTLADYLHMITLKTSVLLAASLQMGAIIGGASQRNAENLYAFGKNLGIAFQVQDDYLDAFGDPEKFGKDAGGDIRQNKKTFLLLHALETATQQQKQQLITLLANKTDDKVEKVLAIFRACHVDEWAKKLKEHYLNIALNNLKNLQVSENSIHPLVELANYLIQRDV